MLKLPANEDEMRAWAWLATRRPRKYRGGGIDEVKATSGPRTLIRTTRVAFEVRAGILVLLLVVLGCRAPAFGQNAKELSTQISPPNLAPTLPLDPARRAELQQALKTRNYTGAETLLVKEIERIPTSAQLLMCLGRVLFLDGKYLNSAVAMKKAEALDPLDDQDRFTLAMAYLALEHADWARPELEKLARSDPRNALYPYWLSRLDYNDMNFAAALTHAQKALELDPGFMKAYDNLGLCLEAIGRIDEAIQSYQQAVRLNEEKHSSSPWPSLNLGALLLRLERSDEAEPYLRESLKEDPRFPKAHFQLGLFLEKRNRYSEAIQELEQAIAFDSSYAEPYYALGRIYRRVGDERDAQKAWRQFQEVSARRREKEKPRKLSR